MYVAPSIALGACFGMVHQSRLVPLKCQWTWWHVGYAAVQANLQAVYSQIFLPANKLGANLADNVALYEPEDPHQVPEQLASQYISEASTMHSIVPHYHNITAIAKV